MYNCDNYIYKAKYTITKAICNWYRRTHPKLIMKNNIFTYKVSRVSYNEKIQLIFPFDIDNIIKEKFLQSQFEKVPTLKNKKLYYKRLIKILNYAPFNKETRALKIIYITNFLKNIIKHFVNRKNVVPFYYVYYIIKFFSSYVERNYLDFSNMYDIYRKFSIINIKILKIVLADDNITNLRVFGLMKEFEYTNILSLINHKLYKKFKELYTFDINESNLVKKNSHKKFFTVHHNGHKLILHFLNSPTTYISTFILSKILHLLIKKTDILYTIRNITKAELDKIYWIIISLFMKEIGNFIVNLFNQKLK